MAKGLGGARCEEGAAGGAFPKVPRGVLTPAARRD